jgi:superfamily II DNA/RNA helicase
MTTNNNNKTQVFQNYETNVPLREFKTFDEEGFDINNDILKGIFSYGYENPTPIQRLAIKPIMEGYDIIAQSHSGSGKTATFITGILHKINQTEKTNQCIIISNTRELADQTFKVFKELTRFTKITGNLCVGGEMQNRYTDNRFNEHVIIGTPGRICDLLNRNIINGSTIKAIVIDEADDVLSSSFKKQVKRIFQNCNNEAQVILLSATIPEDMVSIFPHIMKPNYISIYVRDDEISLEGIKQYYVGNMNEHDKFPTLLEIYKVFSICQAIVYCNKKQKADELKYYLTENNYSVLVLHGDMSTEERKDVMIDFRNGKYRILITTDVLARGIDIQQVSLVINYDMPKCPETFIHRSGRGGRQGRKGLTINFVTKRDRQIFYLIEKTYSIKIEHLPESIDAIADF